MPFNSRRYRDTTLYDQMSLAGRYWFTFSSASGSDIVFILQNDERGVPFVTGGNGSDASIASFEIQFKGRILIPKHSDIEAVFIRVSKVEDEREFVRKITEDLNTSGLGEDIVVDDEPPPDLTDYEDFINNGNVSWLHVPELISVDGDGVTPLVWANFDDALEGPALNMNSFNVCDVADINGHKAISFTTNVSNCISAGNIATLMNVWKIFAVMEFDAGEADRGFCIGHGDTGLDNIFTRQAANEIWVNNTSQHGGAPPKAYLSGKHVFEFDNIDGNNTLRVGIDRTYNHVISTGSNWAWGSGGVLRYGDNASNANIQNVVCKIAFCMGIRGAWTAEQEDALYDYLSEKFLITLDA